MANKLINSKSPYLRQHSDNPVNWYPWSAEAFEKARIEDKPILLSIGYSACHWCYVMGEESFNDNQTAEIINKSFIPIKVDREERPDVDNVYMTVCQTITGSGGWPLNLLLTPSKDPFFAGTYYPKDDMGGRAGLKTLLNNAADAWEKKKEEITKTAEHITNIIKNDEGLYKENISEDAFSLCIDHLSEGFDPEYGGFDHAPKFPMPQIIMFLLSYGKRYGDPKAKEMATTTLQRIYMGGIHDHVGGGYFRYSTDDKWHVPHFEKMLYDNALMAMAYLEEGGNFKHYAREIFDFLIRELQSEDGGFWSAISATTKEGEGAYYIWSPDEVREVLADTADEFCRVYGINKKGALRGKSILNLKSVPTRDFKYELSKLYEKRLLRIAPEIDEKILTGWNALCAAAFARGYKVDKKDSYLMTAERIIEFIDDRLRDEDGRLLARYFENEAGIYAYAEDYAYLMWAFLELYEATENPDYLKRAQDEWNEVLNYFWDERGGAYFYARDAEQLIYRPMEGYDMATPSANSVLMMCLNKLYKITGEESYRENVDKLSYTFGALANRGPTGFCFMLYSMLD